MREKTNQQKFLEARRVPELWYLAGAYSHPDEYIRKTRVEESLRITKELVKFYGQTVYSPIAYCEILAEVETDPPSWYAFNLPILKASDRFLILKSNGWDQSVGVAMEHAFAIANDIPIYIVGGDGRLQGRL